MPSMKPYEFRFVCPYTDCKAIHYYRPSDNRCRRCGRESVLKRESTVSEANGKELALRLEIDLAKLSEEWQGQAQQVYNWGARAAKAQMEFDKAKADEKLERANIDRMVRDDPEAYGIGKLTNEVVNQTVETQPAVRGAVQAVIRARHELAMAHAACNALEHRKRALTMLVELSGREWHADPQRVASAEEDRELVRTRGMRRMSREMADEDEDGSDE